MSVKIVANAGDSTPSDVNNVQVNFQINGGRIYLAPATLDLTQPDYQTSLTTVTEVVDRANGVATVYVEVNNGATATVTAQIVGNNSSRGRHVVTISGVTLTTTTVVAEVIHHRPHRRRILSPFRHRLSTASLVKR